MKDWAAWDVDKITLYCWLYLPRLIYELGGLGGLFGLSLGK